MHEVRARLCDTCGTGNACFYEWITSTKITTNPLDGVGVVSGLLANEPKKKLLEIGCGTEISAFISSKLDIDAVGMDTHAPSSTRA